MRPTAWILGGLLLWTLPALAGEDSRLDVSKVPREAKAPQDFVPAGWKIEETLKGDLNKDNSLDVVLQLVQEGPDRHEDERERALLVLLEVGGKLQRVGASNKLLYCTTCAGLFSTPAPGQMKLKKGVLLVDQYSGSRELLHTLLRFRYEPETQRMRLIGEDVSREDRVLGASTSVSTNLLTGQRITEERRFNPKLEKVVVVSTKKEKVSVSPSYLEEAALPEG